MGKVILKSNGDEALNDVFPQKVIVMKRLTLRKKIVAMKHLTLHRLTLLLHRFALLLPRCQHYINPCRNRHKTGQNTYVKAKVMRFFSFAMETMEITIFGGNYSWN